MGLLARPSSTARVAQAGLSYGVNRFVLTHRLTSIYSRRLWDAAKAIVIAFWRADYACKIERRGATFLIHSAKLCGTHTSKKDYP